MSSATVVLTNPQESIYQNLTPLQWREEMLSLESLQEQTNRGKWIHSPPHQREVVHNDAWGCGIIESLICFGKIPSLVFHPKYTDTGLVYESIDGKQRASKILEALDSKYKLKFTRPELEHINNKYFNELSELQQSEIKNMTIHIQIANRTLTDDEIYCLFTNLQHNKRTTKGETLNAMPSKADELIKNIIGSFDNVIPKDTRKQRTEMAIRMLKSWCFKDDDIKALTEKPNLLDWFKIASVPDDSRLFQTAVTITLDVLEKSSLKHMQAQSTILPVFRVLCNYIHNDPSKLTQVKEFIVGLSPDYFQNVGGDHSAVMNRYIQLKNDITISID